MRDLAQAYPRIREEQAEVLAILPATAAPAAARIQDFPYPVLLDPEDRAHRQLGATDTQGRAAAAVYVTDPFGEIYSACREREGKNLPGLAEIFQCLEFINIQCPECEPPEWPLLKPDEF